MKNLLPAKYQKPMRQALWRALVLRQKAINWVLSGLYGQKMEVLPKGHVGLAGAIVLWMVQDGGRQILMLRAPASKDTRARLVSFMGLGKHGDLATAMKAAIKAQTGEVFAKALKMDKITMDRIAAAPMFTFNDEENGIVTPVQMLVWVAQIQPVQLELLKLDGTELVLVNEQTLINGKAHSVAPTHQALWRSVGRHLPQKSMVREMDSDAREEVVEAPEAASRGRLLH